MRERFLPQQVRLARDKYIHAVLKNAADQLACDLTRVSAAQRVSGGEKDKRDLLMYWVWQSGLFTDEFFQSAGLSTASIEPLRGILAKNQAVYDSG
jgi:hypothetical protein